MLHPKLQQRTSLRFAVATSLNRAMSSKRQPHTESQFVLQGTQTYYSQVQAFGAFVLADSVGNQRGKQEANHLTIQVMSNNLIPPLLGNAELGRNSLLELLIDCVQRANWAVYEHNQQKGLSKGIGVTALLIVDSRAYMLNVGESCIYLYRETEGLFQLIHHDTMLARLFEAGILTPADVDRHTGCSQVYHRLGEKSSVEYDTFSVGLHAGDKLLLCSHNLWTNVQSLTLQRLLSAPVSDPFQTVEALGEAFVEEGGNDSVNMIAVFLS